MIRHIHRARKILSTLIILLAIFLCSSVFAQTAYAESLLVKLAAGLTLAEQTAVVTRNGGFEISAIPALRLHIIEVPTNQLSTILSRYQSDQNVEHVEINYVRKIEGTPPDPLYTNQWALPKIGWDSLFGTTVPLGTATVAVLDTGVDALHPDLSGRLVYGTSIIDGSDGLTDPSGHGTWLAGIIAAQPNAIGMAGVGFAGVQVMPITVLSPVGTGQDSDIIAGILYAADNGADVILMGFSNPGFSQSLQDAIDYAWSQNVVLVAATGNEGFTTPTYPAGDRGVIGVSATDTLDTLASFSNTGSNVFLAAPGVDIMATDLNDSYILINGTSASAAIVAGVAGFIKSVDPSLTNGIIVGRLARTADPAGTVLQTGNGRVNMARAVADTGTGAIQPIGTLDGGGPIVGPYVAATVTINSVSVGSQATPITYSPSTGASTSFIIQVNCSRSGGAGSSFSLSVQNLPAGATFSFSNANPTCPNNPNPANVSSTLTVNTAAGTSAGSTAFTVRATASNQVSGTGALTIAKAAQATLNIVAPASLTYGNTALLSTTGGSGSGTVTFSADASTGCSVAGSTLSVTDATGTCAVSATKAADTNYNAATSAPATVTLLKANQSITVTTPAPASAPYNSSFTVAATAPGGTVAYSSATPSVCTNSGATFTIIASGGTCTVQYNQAGSINYNAAPQVTNATTAGKADQAALNIVAPASLTYGSTALLSTTGGSGSGTVTFSAGASTGCSVAGSTLSVTNATGTCAVTATKAADSNYNAATSAPATVTLLKADQTITFGPLANKTMGDPPFTVSASATSSLPVTFNSLTTSFCTVSGSTVTLVAAGTCTIRAAQTGNVNYNPADNVDQSFTISAASQSQTITVTTAAQGSATYNTTFNVAATASSGLGVEITTTGVCSGSGTGSATITMTSGTGTCTVHYNQAGNGTYSPAPEVTSATTAQKANQTITFDALPPKNVGDDDFSPGATATSGLAISYSSSNTSVATIVGTNIHIVAAGTSTITASQEGNTNYNAAAPQTQELTVGIMPLAIAHTALSVNNFTVSFRDASSGGKPPLQVTVNWQDGTVSSGNAGSTFTHTYMNASHYNIIHTVSDRVSDKDHIQSYASEFIPVAVSADTTTQRFNITVNVSDSDNQPIKNATVYLKKQTSRGWMQIRLGFTDSNGNTVFRNLKENKNYKVVVYKSTIDFDGSTVVKQPKAITSVFTLTTDTTVAIQQGTPATNGPPGKVWKGDDGEPPTISIMP